RHVTRSEVDRALGELLDARARADRLVVDADLWVCLAVHVEGFGVEGLRERRPRARQRTFADVDRGCGRCGPSASGDRTQKNKRHQHTRSTDLQHRFLPKWFCVNGGHATDGWLSRG